MNASLESRNGFVHLGIFLFSTPSKMNKADSLTSSSSVNLFFSPQKLYQVCLSYFVFRVLDFQVFGQ